MRDAVYWEMTGDKACCVLVFIVYGFAQLCHVVLR